MTGGAMSEREAYDTASRLLPGSRVTIKRSWRPSIGDQLLPRRQLRALVDSCRRSVEVANRQLPRNRAASVLATFPLVH